MKKAALITGGSRGIGLGIAKELANAGFNLAINGVRNQKSVQPVLDELKEFGIEVIYVQGDISIKENRQEIFTNTISRIGNLNVLVNNAGIAPKERKDILEASLYHRNVTKNYQFCYGLTKYLESESLNNYESDVLSAMTYKDFKLNNIRSIMHEKLAEKYPESVIIQQEYFVLKLVDI